MTQPKRMLAGIVSGPGKAQVRDVSIPVPREHQVLVRLHGCGVCGSNLPLWEGRPWFDYPVPPGKPGHEGWGEVAAVGRGVRNVREGDRVACLSDAAFAEYDIAQAASLVKLPDSLAAHDLPLEPVGCAMNVWARAAVRPGQEVAVVGVGFLGALLVQIASRAGARVVALARRHWSLQLARRCGADACVQIGDAEGAAAEEALGLTAGRGYDCVFEAAGHQSSLDLASQLCTTRGRLLIAGFHQDGPRLVDMQSWNWRGLDVINAHERDPQRYVQGMSRALEAIIDGRIDLSLLLTHRKVLEDFGQALQLLSTRPDGFAKAVVVP